MENKVKIARPSLRNGSPGIKIKDCKTIIINLSSNGSGLSKVTLYSNKVSYINTTGNAKICLDSTGYKVYDGGLRLSEGDNTFYVFCKSGKGEIIIPESNKVTKIIEWTLSSTAPTMGFDISNWNYLEHINIAQNNNIWGSITDLTDLTYYNVLTANVITGSITKLVKLTYFYTLTTKPLSGSITNLTKLINFTCYGAAHTVTGDISGLVEMISFFSHVNSFTGSVTNLTKITSFTCVGSSNLSGSISGHTVNTNFYVGTNSITGDIANCVNLIVISIGSSNTVYGDISYCPNLSYVDITGTGVISGSIAGLTKLTVFAVNNYNTVSGSVAALTKLATFVVAGTNTLSGSIAALTKLVGLSLKGNNTVYGSINALTLLQSVSLEGSNTVSGEISGLTALYSCLIWGSSTVTYSNTTNITGLCNLVINTTTILTSGNVNQILADFWANRNSAKPVTTRVINLEGDPTTGSPTGQGIIDKAALQAERSPNPPGTAALWTVTTR